MTMDSVVQAYRSIGYELGGSVAEVEAGVEQICIYQLRGYPIDAARQNPVSGLWTSKLGTLHLITHRLNGVEGSAYGSIECMLRRHVQTTPPRSCRLTTGRVVPAPKRAGDQGTFTTTAEW